MSRLLRNYGKNVKKSVKKEILQSLLKSTQQVKRKINRERGGAKGKWLNLEKKVYDNGAVLLELLDSFINVNSLLVKALYSSFARYIYFKCWDFFPESNIIPPTTFCCTFKTIVVCVETGKLSEKSYQKWRDIFLDRHYYYTRCIFCQLPPLYHLSMSPVN